MVTVPGMSVAHPDRSPALQSCRSNAEIVSSPLAVYRVWLAGSIWTSEGKMAVGIVPSWAHPDCTVALHVLASNTETPLVPAGHPESGSPHTVTYTVWVDESTAPATALLGTATVGGGVVGQAARSVALHVAVSSIETSSSTPSGMYRVWLAGSAKIPIGPEPTGTVAGVCPQPHGCSPLHVAPLNTDTVLSPKLVTYTVSVCSSIAMPLGRFPTVIVGHGP